MSTTRARDSRLYVRADSAEKARIEYAAELARQSVSEFVRLAVEARAEEIISARTGNRSSRGRLQRYSRRIRSPCSGCEVVRQAPSSRGGPAVRSEVGPQHRRVRLRELHANMSQTASTAGKTVLDDWLKRAALNQAEKGTYSNTYVWSDGSLDVLAYFTLSVHTIGRDDVPKSVGRGGPAVIPGSY